MFDLIRKYLCLNNPLQEHLRKLRGSPLTKNRLAVCALRALELLMWLRYLILNQTEAHFYARASKGVKVKRKVHSRNGLALSATWAFRTPHLALAV